MAAVACSSSQTHDSTPSRFSRPADNSLFKQFSELKVVLEPTDVGEYDLHDLVDMSQPVLRQLHADSQEGQVLQRGRGEGRQALRPAAALQQRQDGSVGLVAQQVR